MDALREDEHVRSETVPAEVGGLPESFRRDVRRQRIEERWAEARAACVTAAVSADEDNRADGGISLREICPGKLVERLELLPDCASSTLVDRCLDDRHATTAIGSAHQEYLPRERIDSVTDCRRKPAVDDGVSPPRPAHLDQKPARSLGRSSRERLSRGER